MELEIRRPGSQASSAEPSEEAERGEKKRTPLFEYPELPKAEIGAYFTLVMSIMIWLIYIVFDATRNYKYKRIGKGGQYVVPSALPFYGPLYKDISDWEWRLFTPFLKMMVPVYAGHAVVFNVSAYFLGERRRLWEAVRLAYTLSATVHIFSFRMVAYMLASGLLLFSIGWFSNGKRLVWLAAAPLLYINLEYIEQISGLRIVFVPLLYSSYKLLSYIAFCSDSFPRHPPILRPGGSESEEGDGKGEKKEEEKAEETTFFWTFWDMIVYANYLPYCLSVICPYKDYCDQMRERSQQIRSWAGIACFAVRVAIWACLAEAAVHLLHFTSLLLDVDYLRNIPLTLFCSLGFLAGQFFHLKYVVIFGLPNLFARIDAMQPLPGPICVPRLYLYSHMWRGFDRGLYRFFKRYIFIPICAPTFSTPRKALGMLTSFAFVLLWHGLRHMYIVWIVLNIIELVLEQVSKGIYAIPAVKAFRERNLSDRNFRRFIACFWIIPYSFSFYASYYFLTGSDTAGLMVQRMFFENTYPYPSPYFLTLWFLSYFHAQCCMECDRLIALAQRKEKED